MAARADGADDPDLEDLARRYDAQVLREYLLENADVNQNQRRGTSLASGLLNSSGAASSTERLQVPEVFDLRPRCFGRLRLLLAINVVAFWSALIYCGHSFCLRVSEVGASSLPPLSEVLLAIFILGSQSTLELAATVCLTRPERDRSGMSSDMGIIDFGIKHRDVLGWLVGLGARASIWADLLCLPLMWRGSELLFYISTCVYIVAIGAFVFSIQLRLLVGLFISGDHFSYDKPDLFFKGRDAYVNSTEGTRIAARHIQSSPLSSDSETEETDSEIRASSPSPLERPPPFTVIKVANMAHLCDLHMLHSALTRLYIPVGCQETQEFVTSATSFSRCFGHDVVQCSVKFFFLMDCESNLLVLLSFLLSITQSINMCLFATTTNLELRNEEANDTSHE